MPLIKLDNPKYKEDINRLAGGELLQSTIWRDLLLQEKETATIWGLEKNGEIKATTLVIYKKLLASFYYGYLPRGPLGKKEDALELLQALKIECQDAVFLRIEPTANLTTEIHLKKTIDLQPQKTLLLDLSLSAAELLKAMHPKTRYNIRLAEKKGVVVTLEDNSSFPEFWRLMSLTGERDGFRLHDRSHYENLLRASDNIKLFVARFEGRIIAAGLFSFFGDRVTYLHGASDNKDRNLMAPYLLQWTVIQEAQKLNQNKIIFKYYDFYGIDEQKWPGVTRFKLGFGGFVKEYPGTYDFVGRPFIYNLYNSLREGRKSLRKVMRFFRR